MKKYVVICMLLCCGLSGCEDQGTESALSGDLATITYHEHAKPIIERSCVPCHFEGGTAYFSLTSYEMASGLAPALRTAIATRKMPPWPADDTCQKYHDSRRLPEADLQLLLAWIDGGALEGHPDDAPPEAEPIEIQTLPRVDLILSAPEPYTPQEPAGDEYRCFLLDWPYDVPMALTGYRMMPDNLAVVHHADIFLVGPELASEYAAAGATYALDCAQPKHDAEKVLGAWAPSAGDAFLYPEGSGVIIEPGSKILLEVHYNTVSYGPQPDHTSIRCMVEPLQAIDEEVHLLTFANYDLIENLHIPAHSATREEYIDDPFPQFHALSKGRLGRVPVEVHAVAGHMHELGDTFEVEILRQDGSQECLLSIPRWDYHWHMFYILEEPVRIDPGDQMRLVGTWDNTQANQPYERGIQLEPVDTTWGVGSRDEMLFAILFLTEA